MSEIKIPPKKQRFDIKVECLVPTTFTYTIEAETEQQALKEFEQGKHKHKGAIPHQQKAMKLKATVYVANTHMIKLSKAYR